MFVGILFSKGSTTHWSDFDFPIPLIILLARSWAGSLIFIACYSACAGQHVEHHTSLVREIHCMTKSGEE